MQAPLATPTTNTPVLTRLSAPRPYECQSVLTKLSAPPRKLHANPEKRLSLFKFVALCTLAVLAAGCAYLMVEQFFASDNDLYWIGIIAVLAPTYIYLNYALLKRTNKRAASLKMVRKLYEEGCATIGYVNMLTMVKNGEYQNYYLEDHAHHSPNHYLRVDYTYLVDDKTLAASNWLKIRTALELKINDPIVVLYDPNEPQHAMLFPIPKNELATTFF